MSEVQSEKWWNCYEGQRKELFPRSTNAHPAKMSVALCFRIFQHMEERGWIAKGDLVLDPMCGCGTSLVCGAVLGFRVMGIELEKHFVGLCEQSIEFARPKFHSMGNCWVVQGDARNLRGIDVSAAITSPPYGDTSMPSSVRSEIRQLARAGRWTEAVAQLRRIDQADMEKGNRRSPHSDEYYRTMLEQALERDEGNYAARAPRAVVTSPPYADQQLTGQGHFRSAREPDRVSAAENPRERYDGVVASPPYGDMSVIAGAGMTYEVLKVAKEKGMEAAVKFYRKNGMDRQKAHDRWSDNNIRRHIEMALATRENGYSGVVSSPPYPSAFREEHAGTKDGKVAQEFERGGSFRGYSGVVSSPPYPMPEGGGKGIAKTGHRFDPGLAARQYVPEQFSNDGAQIGNLKDPMGDIDGILSSPPWEKGARGGQQGWSDPEKASKIAADRYKDKSRKGHSASAEAIKRQMERDDQRVYGESEGQIGNSKGQTYLSAMGAVYSAMYRVLKPGGVVALVLKNPVKRGAIRRLDLDTIALMEYCGFTLIERKMAMLQDEVVHGDLFQGQTVKTRARLSFFKRLHIKKHPDLAVLHEDLLFFRKLGKESQ